MILSVQGNHNNEVSTMQPGVLQSVLCNGEKGNIGDLINTSDSIVLREGSRERGMTVYCYQ